jgi:IS4 transposase
MEKFGHDLRVITFFDEETKNEYEFITNNFNLSAGTLAKVYKHRWQIELFFKWIKQHLKVKTFLGTSKNAVMMQIWIAMIYYLILSYIKYSNRLKSSLLTISRVI